MYIELGRRKPRASCSSIERRPAWRGPHRRGQAAAAGRRPAAAAAHRAAHYTALGNHCAIHRAGLGGRALGGKGYERKEASCL